MRYPKESSKCGNELFDRTRIYCTNNTKLYHPERFKVLYIFNFKEAYNNELQAVLHIELCGNSMRLSFAENNIMFINKTILPIDAYLGFKSMNGLCNFWDQCLFKWLRNLRFWN